MKFWREEIIMGGIFGLGTVLCLLGITITLASMSIDNLLDFIGRVVLVIIIGFALFIVGTLWGSDSEFIAGYTLFIRSWVVVAICIGLVVTINDGSVPVLIMAGLTLIGGALIIWLEYLLRKNDHFLSFGWLFVFATAISIWPSLGIADYMSKTHFKALACKLEFVNNPLMVKIEDDNLAAERLKKFFYLELVDGKRVSFNEATFNIERTSTETILPNGARTVNERFIMTATFPDNVKGPIKSVVVKRALFPDAVFVCPSFSESS